MQSSSRNGARVRVLAVHTSEGNDEPNIDDAAALRDASWWEGSSHAIADNDPGSLLTPAEGCVPYERASWTLRSGNPWSENIELIAQAGWTRAEWLARPRLLDRCAHWLADRSKARGIPLVKLTPQQYRAGGWGVIGHVDHTVGYSDGTHWDPGPDFPYDVVLAKANAYRNGHSQEDDDMTPDQVAALNEIRGFMQNVAPAVGQIAGRVADIHGKMTTRYDLGGRPGPEEDDLYGHLLSARAAVEQAPVAGKVAVDAAAVGAALAADDKFMGALSARIADDIAARLQS